MSGLCQVRDRTKDPRSPQPSAGPRVDSRAGARRSRDGDARSDVNATALTSFGETFDGEIVLPGSAAYDPARAVWNGMIDRRPAIVARCGGVEDVISAIRFGREQDLVIAVRSGGHSVGGFSTCDGGIVIDLSRMRGVQVDVERRTAQVDGGTLLRELDERAQAVGLVCPVGVVGHTGVAGLTLGGGMGRLQRRFGFSVDSMLAVDLVTAEGKQLRVSEDENADLFWGIRGAGPNFGIVTSFEFRLHELGPTITQGAIAFPADRAHEVAVRAREFLASAPDEVMCSFWLGVAPEEPPFPPELAGRPVVSMAVTHCGDVQGAESVIRPLRDLGPAVDTIEPRGYLDVQASADEEMVWGKRFYMKGGYLSELSDGYVDVALGCVADPPGRDCGITLWAQGGAIARVADEAMAFTGRHAPFWLGVEAAWDDPLRDDAHRAWGRSTMEALQPFTVAGHYVNDMVESGEDIVRGIYGLAKYERLVDLKRTYDPDNVFRMNQNIQP
jgi:FAD/FMN-containing dehydrogenase